MGKAGTSGRVPLEALILAFSHSRAKALVGTDALRSVLSGQYREVQSDNWFDLEPVWQLLSQQPGFDPAHVRPALCRFKSWEKELALEVRMPAEMAELSEQQRSELAAQVHVPAPERARVLGGAQVPPDDPEAWAAQKAEASPRLDAGRTGKVSRGLARPPSPAVSSVPPTVKTRALRRLTDGQRRVLEIAAAVLALFGFALAGYQLQRGCRTQQWDTVAVRFAGDIPLAAARRQGPEVSGALRDARWLGQSAAVRPPQMKAAREALPREVQVFFVRDAAGKVRAVARWYGQPRQIAVTLQ